jgi:hypothetical protein
MVGAKLATQVLVIWILTQSRMNALSWETMRAPGWREPARRLSRRSPSAESGQPGTSAMGPKADSDGASESGR